VSTKMREQAHAAGQTLVARSRRRSEETQYLAPPLVEPAPATGPSARPRAAPGHETARKIWLTGPGFPAQRSLRRPSIPLLPGPDLAINRVGGTTLPLHTETPIALSSRQSPPKSENKHMLRARPWSRARPVEPKRPSTWRLAPPLV